MMKRLINSTAAHFVRFTGRRMYSSRIIAGQSWTPEGIMVSRQKELPPLPVLPLQVLLRRRINSVKPVLTAEELNAFQKVVHDFGKPGGDGELLHKLLVEKASRIPNWFSEWIVGIYLRNRLPMLSTTGAMCLPRQAFTTKEDQLRQAAALAAGALDFKHLIEREHLQPEVRGTTPLDMLQYKSIFRVYRVPSKSYDKLEFNTLNHKSEENVLVIHNGQDGMIHEYADHTYVMFTFNAYDDRGVPHDERRILTHLIRVVEMSPEKDVGVGILTAQDRDVWAEAYARLGQNAQNAASLEAINKAVVVVCLDGGMADTEPYEVAWPRQVYRGGANAEYGANRWWDKPVQIVVGEDGGSALLYDHTDCDGTVMAGVTNHCYNYAKKAGSFEASQDNAEAVPQKLEFVMGPDTLHDLEKARSFHWSHSADAKRLMYQYLNYGKKFVQSCNMSPDGYVQMAMQLAAYRSVGARFMMTGAASTRKFLHGRVEVYITITEESQSFCRVFDNPRSSRTEREQSLRKAVARCKQDSALANLQCDGPSFADLGSPYMYFVAYNIRPESFIFGITSNKYFPGKNAVKFKNALEEALNELGDCVTPSC